MPKKRKIITEQKVQISIRENGSGGMKITLDFDPALPGENLLKKYTKSERELQGAAIHIAETVMNSLEKQGGK